MREDHSKFNQDLQRRIQRSQKEAAEKGETFGVKENQVVVNLGHYKNHNDVFLTVRGQLKEHQINGIRFMWKELIQSVANSKEQAGALLAHTMGLGKTLQVITLIYAIAKTSASKDPRDHGQLPEHFRGGLKSLVLAPPGLIDNWVSEFARWIPSKFTGTRAALTVEHIGPVWPIVAHGDGGARTRDLIKQFASSSNGVLIIGYQMFRSIIQDGLNEGSKFKSTRKQLLEAPDLVIADEAHQLKNQHAQLTKCARYFRTRSRIAMTGSPLSNNLEEYWNMIEWIHPGFLGPAKEFRAKYVQPIQAGLYRDSAPHEVRKSKKMLAVLHKTIQPKIHRADISVIHKDMPNKVEFMITVPLTEIQKRFYEDFLNDLEQDIDQVGMGPAWIQEKRTAGLILNASFLMGLITAHPKCFVQAIKRRTEQRKNKAAKSTLKPHQPAEPTGTDVSDIELPKLLDEDEVLEEETLAAAPDYGTLSNKFRAVTDIVRASVAAKDKLLIFSHHIETLDALDQHLSHLGVSYKRLDGSVNVSKRQQMVTAFNNGPGPADHVMLISTQAGGLGLNLYGANRVIIFDFKWSPMWEQQAVGRAYRMGQTKHVFVYRFLSGGTFEDCVNNLAAFKNNLQNRVLDQRDLIRSAKKNLDQYRRKPRIVEKNHEVVKTFKGKDPKVLDTMLLGEENGYIVNLQETETFMRDEDEDDLTEDEVKEVE
ncbi:hypothetical protein EX30DRAFT_310707, partial [Ascodesmis nigricans]